jgi:hypothetical protein
MKSYEEQNYPVSVPVRVTWADGLIHEDEIKGLNIGHAIFLARLNWPDAATITAHNNQFN